MATIELLHGPNSLSINAGTGESVLDAALAQGCTLTFSCKRGDCGQCAASVLSGEVQALIPSLPWKRESDCLLCNTVASGHVRLRLPYFPEAAHLKLTRGPSKIAAIRMLGDVVEVTLKLPPAMKFDFLPGQFVRLTNPRGVTRSYSLSSGPAPDRQLRMQVRKVEGGSFSAYLFNEAKPGDLLQLEGPFGQFFLRSAGSFEHSIFLATGTGIAPIFAMLDAMTFEQRERSGNIRIYWGNRTLADAYLAAEINELCARIGASCTILASRESASVEVPNKYVQEAMAADFKSLERSQIFACGNSQMIDQARSRSLALGLLAEHFHSDPFTAS